MDVSDLIQIEAIKVLRARYCRLVDSKDWPGFRALFTDGFIYVDDAKDLTIETADAFVEFVSTRHASSISVHQACMPEIDLIAEGSASGIWAVSDYVEIPCKGGRMIQEGSGNYFEDYVQQHGAWRFARIHLTRFQITVSEVR